MQRALRLLLADDHPILRAGVRRLLAEMPEVAAIDEAGDGNEVLQRLRAGPWDIVILDLEMPGLPSLDVLKRIRASHPQTAVLVLSMYAEERFALRVLRAGAAGYVDKAMAPERLVTAVRVIADGGSFFSARLTAVLTQGARAPAGIDELLSDRELSVLRGLAQGKSAKDVSRELAISAKTVSTYRSRLLAKLNLRGATDLARFAAEHGLVK